MVKRLALITLLITLFPIFVLAQIWCCKLGNTISYQTITYNKGIWVAEGKATSSECALNAPAITNPCPTTTGATAGSDCYTPEWGTLCLLNTIYSVTSWISYILVAVAAIMIIMGAFTLTTAAGAPDKVSSGKNYILYAIVGLIAAILSRAIPAIAKRFVGA